MITVGSLFSGIGGFDLGLERAGMQVKWQVEIDKYCLKVLEKHWPHVTRYTDIREIDWYTVDSVDIVCGGFPCQPVSCAGKRKGEADPRWLWPEFIRCIAIIEPAFVLIENVPGLLSQGMGRVLCDLAAIGYDAEWSIVSAAGVGAPHLRKRVFIVAHSTSKRPQGQRPKCELGEGSEEMQTRWSGTFMADAQCDDNWRPDGSWRWEWQQGETESGWLGKDGYRCIEPPVGRVADGIPHRVDRLRGLGNAVVPQIVEWIGRRILEAERTRRGA